MSSESLTESERKVVKETLRAVVFGSFLDEWEFHTLMGLTREEVKEVAEAYPNVDELDEGASGCDDSWLAINNSFVNLLEFSKGKENEYKEYLSIPISELGATFRKWRDGKAKPASGGNG